MTRPIFLTYHLDLETKAQRSAVTVPHQECLCDPQNDCTDTERDEASNPHHLKRSVNYPYPQRSADVAILATQSTWECTVTRTPSQNFQRLETTILPKYVPMIIPSTS